ncbi:hypothetical protein TRIP_C20009 [Candidatus Zixiibacteriota bacterium]|nr:hypothetical protein TRIP_C20009 [candidate division Zixibacteria bacterium]
MTCLNIILAWKAVAIIGLVDSSKIIEYSFLINVIYMDCYYKSFRYNININVSLWMMLWQVFINFQNA